MRLLKEFIGLLVEVGNLVLELLLCVIRMVSTIVTVCLMIYFWPVVGAIAFISLVYLMVHFFWYVLFGGAVITWMLLWAIGRSTSV